MDSRSGPINLLVLAVASVTPFLTPEAAAVGDHLLAKYETDYEAFERAEICDKIVYYRQRMIDDAIVEGDHVVYQFDKASLDLLKKRMHWRTDVPEHVTPLISQEEAESVASGEVQYTKLYIISPESDVFPVEPPPRNPCWVVRSLDGSTATVTIVDAVEGRILGYGIPPPYTGFSLSGPWYFNPCSGAWSDWYQSAEYWFSLMGYATEAVQWPTEETIQGHVQSCSTAVFYELAHGSSHYFSSGCADGNSAEDTYASEIAAWIQDYAKMPFAFIGSCEGMCDTTDNTFSYEFRKGPGEKSVTVGYCHMAEPECDDAWSYSIAWQDAMFYYMSEGYTVKDAFDQSIADYPMCMRCMRFAGDRNFAIVPVVRRNHRPLLSGGHVHPQASYVDTTFTYDVSYHDTEEDPPISAYIFIDGEPHEMNLQPPGDFLYTYQTSLPEGLHEYYFYFEDNCGGSRLPDSGTFAGPDVMAPHFIRGDANADTLNTIADAVYIINHVYRDGPCGCEDACDVNDDGRITSADAVYLVGYIYRGGLLPAEPFLNCGGDSSEDELGCDNHPCMEGDRLLHQKGGRR